jgi:hypothetical protein
VEAQKNCFQPKFRARFAHRRERTARPRTAESAPHRANRPPAHRAPHRARAPKCTDTVQKVLQITVFNGFYGIFSSFHGIFYKMRGDEATF